MRGKRSPAIRYPLWQSNAKAAVHLRWRSCHDHLSKDPCKHALEWERPAKLEKRCFRHDLACSHSVGAYSTLSRFQIRPEGYRASKAIPGIPGRWGHLTNTSTKGPPRGRKTEKVFCLMRAPFYLLPVEFRFFRQGHPGPGFCDRIFPTEIVVCFFRECPKARHRPVGDSAPPPPACETRCDQPTQVRIRRVGNPQTPPSPSPTTRSKASVSRCVSGNIGFTSRKRLSLEKADIENPAHPQSADIRTGRRRAAAGPPTRKEGAGDQGIMFRLTPPTKRRT